ncbi:hypothetical protein WN51_06685 [Melipona quadrifasciata]|uniref:Uncharacterized protein n=1 Tax=Melipona quadrifasciata TaxID=166423 RepID=A0A0M9ABF0_9HYME|nr:hypothetical protein WN51_06685 [Melipona quadrifasciata]
MIILELKGNRSSNLSPNFLFYCSVMMIQKNPNVIDHHGRNDTLLPASREKSRFRTLTWDQYDPVHQKYLEIETCFKKSCNLEEYKLTQLPNIQCQRQERRNHLLRLLSEVKEKSSSIERQIYEAEIY